MKEWANYGINGLNKINRQKEQTCVKLMKEQLKIWLTYERMNKWFNKWN